MSTRSEGLGEGRCPMCGSRLAAGIDGHCAACLMRLAAPEDAGALHDETDAPRDETGAAPAAAKTSETPVAGRRIGNYELINTIARGGMGIVYRARQLVAGRVVALKIMLPHLLHMPGMLMRFRQEVEVVAQLDHPGILPIYEVGEQDGLPFFSMKLAEGGPLDQRLRSFAGQWRAIATVMAQVARAIEHAHARGVLHRDLKPANILFDAQGEPTVADFGLAKFRALERGLTLPTSALGSPHYMAPEQISAQFGDVGPPTDVYSLGAVLYEMLTGAPPIVGDDVTTTLRLITTFTPVAGSQTRPDVPAALDAIALKCLAKDPRQRYATAGDLAQDLERWLAGSEAAALSEGRRKRVKRALRWMGLSLLALGVLGGGALFWERISRAGRVTSTPAAAEQSAPRSLAVLQFRNAGGDPRDSYLTSSITDDLLYELRQVATFSVVPFRVDVDTAHGFPPGELSSKLGVQVALEGDFARSGRDLKVNARLWDAETGKQMWQYSFSTPAGEPRDVRTQIATTLVTRLQVELGTDAGGRARHVAFTPSAEAFDDYMRARYLIRWRRPETLAEAARLLRAAIALDPSFARAHSALAYCYALWVGPTPAEGESWDLARDYAQRAAALDDRLGEPYAVLGNDAASRGDFMSAENWFQQAMARDPHDPATLHFYAIHLYSVGKLRAALEMEQRGVALDASSPQPMMWLAMLTTRVGDVSEARRLWARTDELGAARPLSAAIVRLELGQTEFLGEWYPQHWPESGVPEPYRDAHVLVAGVLDPTKRAPALQWLHNVEPKANPAFLITHYALLGDADNALRIAQSYRLTDDDNYLYQLTTIWAPQTAVLRTDPRFGALLKRWGFVDYWIRYGPGDLCSVSPAGSVSCR